MDTDMVRKLQRKLRIKWRVLREKPRFVLGYVMDALFAWVLGLTVAVVGFVLFPALASSGSMAGFRLPSFSEVLNADKAGQIVGAVIEKMRQFSLSGVFRFVTQDIPNDLRRLSVNLCELVKRWRELLGKFAALLLAPRKIWERLQAFWERYKVKIKAVATRALGIAISFALFRLLMYAAPRLGVGVLTIWGVNAGAFVLQWCVALVSPPIARKLRTALHTMWATREKRKLHKAGEAFVSTVRGAIAGPGKPAEPICKEATMRDSL